VWHEKQTVLRRSSLVPVNRREASEKRLNSVRSWQVGLRERPRHGPLGALA